MLAAMARHRAAPIATERQKPLSLEWTENLRSNLRGRVMKPRSTSRSRPR
jgi:hypothetical protein